MSTRTLGWRVWAGLGVWALVAGATQPAVGLLNLGPEELVQAGGANLDVGDYSVPCYADWNNDTIPDLVIGEKTTDSKGKVRIYLNSGTLGNPQFSTTFSYAQAGGADLSVTATGCLGAFPRVVQWDGDGKKDLLVGDAYGYVTLYLNNNTDSNPTFSAGTRVKVGQPGSKLDIDVGDRATPTIVDWNMDGKKDLVVGAMDGKFRVYVNEGTDTAPDFRVVSIIQNQDGGGDLLVAGTFGQRSSPEFGYFDDEGKKDLLTGNTDGQLILYHNVGTDTAPLFAASSLTYVEADGVPIHLAGLPRSRPHICDWTGDGQLDVLIGAADGLIHLYQGEPPPSLLGVVSRKAHPVVGDLDIELSLLVPPEAADIECREGGPERIVLTFSEPVLLGCGNVHLTAPSSCTGVTDLGGGVYEVGVSGTPDKSCLVVTLVGVVDVDDGVPLTGDTDVPVVVLWGDANEDYHADLTDMALLKSLAVSGTPLGQTTARFDINMDGKIDLTDMALAKSLGIIGGQAHCQ